jgi:hypothetical protein
MIVKYEHIDWGLPAPNIPYPVHIKTVSAARTIRKFFLAFCV